MDLTITFFGLCGIYSKRPSVWLPHSDTAGDGHGHSAHHQPLLAVPTRNVAVEETSLLPDTTVYIGHTEYALWRAYDSRIAVLDYVGQSKTRKNQKTGAPKVLGFQSIHKTAEPNEAVEKLSTIYGCSSIQLPNDGQWSTSGIAQSDYLEVVNADDETIDQFATGIEWSKAMDLCELQFSGTARNGIIVLTAGDEGKSRESKVDLTISNTGVSTRSLTHFEFYYRLLKTDETDRKRRLRRVSPQQASSRGRRRPPIWECVPPVCLDRETS